MSDQVTGQDEPKVIFRDDGTPFKTAAAAQAHITRKGLDASRNVVEPRGEGWVIVEAKQVLSVRTQEASNAARSRMGEVQKDASGKAVDKFYKARFHPKATKNDDEDCFLGVNGETLQIQRNVLVIVPGRFLEAADHGMYQHYLVEPGKDRKVAYEVITYPYDLLGEATEAEYREFVKTGQCHL